VKFLFKKRVPADNAFFSACLTDRTEVINYLCDRGAHVNATFVYIGGISVTALHVPCQNGSTKTVEQLIARGADLDICLVDGRSAIETAYHMGHPDIVKIMHVAGAVISPSLARRSGLQTRPKKTVSLAICDLGDIRQTCANVECGQVETSYAEYSCCGECKVVFYCSKECQVAAWRSHRKRCREATAARKRKEEDEYHRGEAGGEKEGGEP
jgi:hypothetical protein